MLFSESRGLVRSGRSGSGEFLPERLAEAKVVGKDGRARYSAGDMTAYLSEAFSRKRTANRGGTTGFSPSSAEQHPRRTAFLFAAIREREESK